MRGDAILGGARPRVAEAFRRGPGLGPAAERALLDLGAVTDTIDWKVDERALIDSKEMDTVRHLAAVALRLIESNSDN